MLVAFQRRAGVLNAQGLPSGAPDEATLKALSEFGSFFASDGSGCDALAQVKSGSGRQFSAWVDRRCGAPPCRLVGYRHRAAPATVLGVRACSDHVVIAGDEDMWMREALPEDLFSVWEVMTT